MGIAALVLGIVALLISWVPILNNLAAIVAFIGIILGGFAIYSTRPSGKKSGRGLSIAGTVICVVAVAIVLFTQYIYGKALDEVGKALDKPAAVANKDSSDTSSVSKNNDKDTGKEKSENSLIDGKYLIENIQVKKSGQTSKVNQLL